MLEDGGFGVPLIEAWACGLPGGDDGLCEYAGIGAAWDCGASGGEDVAHLESWWAVPDVGGLPRRWRRCVVGAADVWAAGGVMQAQAFIKSLVGMWCRRGWQRGAGGGKGMKDSVIAGLCRCCWIGTAMAR